MYKHLEIKEVLTDCQFYDLYFKNENVDVREVLCAGFNF